MMKIEFKTDNASFDEYGDYQVRKILEEIAEPALKETDEDYSICIIGERKPSYEEAKEFCQSDMKQMGYQYVVSIREITDYEAHEFFDMERENTFPIFK